MLAQHHWQSSGSAEHPLEFSRMCILHCLQVLWQNCGSFDLSKVSNLTGLNTTSVARKIIRHISSSTRISDGKNPAYQHFGKAHWTNRQRQQPRSYLIYHITVQSRVDHEHIASLPSCGSFERVTLSTIPAASEFRTSGSVPVVLRLSSERIAAREMILAAFQYCREQWPCSRWNIRYRS